MDLKETDILGDAINEHWYYCSKAAATTRMLGKAPIKRILDVGAGSGFFSHHLLTHTDAREAWCVDISYPADSSATTAGKPVHYRRGIETIDADLVLLMDVLEHVDDDLGLLKMYVDKVPSGSRFLMKCRRSSSCGAVTTTFSSTSAATRWLSSKRWRVMLV
ncbi:hypothetical protein PMI19_01644 [Pseudomonas sp. GM16]|nr:hypothetical protein PMI19_01644 [Pseudomonas sp. GM16]